jgi:hypothetical protein
MIMIIISLENSEHAFLLILCLQAFFCFFFSQYQTEKKIKYRHITPKHTQNKRQHGRDDQHNIRCGQHCRRHRFKFAAHYRSADLRNPHLLYHYARGIVLQVIDSWGIVLQVNESWGIVLRVNDSWGIVFVILVNPISCSSNSK